MGPIKDAHLTGKSCVLGLDFDRVPFTVIQGYLGVTCLPKGSVGPGDFFQLFLSTDGRMEECNVIFNVCLCLDSPRFGRGGVNQFAS